MVHSLAMQVLSTTAEDALNFWRKRVAKRELKADRCEELMQSDEAQVLLGRHDHTKVTQEQIAAAQSVLETKELKVEYAKGCRGAASAKEAATKGKGGLKKKTRAPASPKVIVILEWPRRDAELRCSRSLCPPGGTMWAPLCLENLQAHYKSLSRVSRSWQNYGCAQSLNERLQYVLVEESTLSSARPNAHET